MVKRSTRNPCPRLARGLGLAVLLMLALLPRPGSALSVELEGRLWSADFDGRADGGEEFPVLALDQTLDFDSDEVLEGRFTFRPGLGLFARAAYSELSTRGGRDVAVSLIDFPIVIDSRLTTGLDLEYGRLALGWQFVSPKKLLRVGPYVEVKAFRGDARVALTGPVLEATLTEDFEAAFASVGGLVEAQPLEKLQVFAELSVLVEEDQADLSDAEIGVRFFPVGVLGIGAGYRSVDIDGEIDRVRLDIDFSGFFFTALLRF